jgi:hypothetical protein
MADKIEVTVHQEYSNFAHEFGLTLVLATTWANDEPITYSITKITGTRLPTTDPLYSKNHIAVGDVLAPTMKNFAVLSKRFAQMVKPYLSLEL